MLFVFLNSSKKQESKGGIIPILMRCKVRALIFPIVVRRNKANMLLEGLHTNLGNRLVTAFGHGHEFDVHDRGEDETYHGTHGRPSHC